MYRIPDLPFPFELETNRIHETLVMHSKTANRVHESIVITKKTAFSGYEAKGLYPDCVRSADAFESPITQVPHFDNNRHYEQDVFFPLTLTYRLIANTPCSQLGLAKGRNCDRTADGI